MINLNFKLLGGEKALVIIDKNDETWCNVDKCAISHCTSVGIDCRGNSNVTISNTLIKNCNLSGLQVDTENKVSILINIFD